MGQTVVEKIAERHLADGAPSHPLRTGDYVSIRPRHVMTHDNTAAVMKKFEGLGVPRIPDPRQPVFTLDHDIQNTSEGNLSKYRAIEAFAREQGVDFHPAGSGIGHQIMVEEGYVVPGSFVVASDSHSNMYGALGAVGTPVVRTDAAAIWAAGTFWWQIPRTVQVVLEGALPGGVSGKDVIVALCGLYNHGEVLNAAVEFAGPGVASLSMEARLTISNMSTEWGALVGWFPVDAATCAFMKTVQERLAARGLERFRDQDLAAWAASPLGPDPDADYAGRIVLDLSALTPHVSGPDTVQAMTSLAELDARNVAIDKAYIVSCVNSRLEDLTAAARVLAGKHVAEGVELYLAAASRRVQEAAEASGVWATLLEAGARPLPPGCGPCIGLGAGLLEPGEVGISATNRNFKGRMGSREAQCYLASPEVVAASAVAGRITGPGKLSHRKLTPRFQELESAAPEAPARVEILDGFPERVTGRLVFLPPDNLNTDGIYGKDYTYREDMTREDMARVVMENYDPGFGGKVRPGDVVVGGFNFGTGSSREQAVTALQAKGIPLVVAGDFSQTYLRNAFNNGFVCIESPKLVRRLREQFADPIAAGERTLVPGEELEVDFTTGNHPVAGRDLPVPSPLHRAPGPGGGGGGGEPGPGRRPRPALSFRPGPAPGSRSTTIPAGPARTAPADATEGAERMARYTVVAMPGDGIGKTVLPESVRVLDAVGFDAEYVHADIGWDFWVNEGNALPERTVELLAEHKLGLFGAITSKPKKEAAGELRADLRDQGFSYFSPIVGLRQRFSLDVCIRPCRSFPGNPLNFIRRTRDGGFEEPLVDAVIFRQNTEGMYAGVEWTDPPPPVRAALESHPKFKAFSGVSGPDLAVSTRIVTRPAARRIMRAAFEYAKKHGYESVTVCEKPNVLRETSGMMEDTAREVQKDFPGIQLRSTNIDAQMMWLTKNPEDYGVLVAENLFGDIVSDAFAGLVGGLGFACSGNIGRRGGGVRAHPRFRSQVPGAGSPHREPHGHDPLRGHAPGPRGGDREGADGSGTRWRRWCARGRCGPTT